MKIAKLYVDILIPEDEYTPSASSLGIHLEILGKINAESFYKKIFDAGCNWLDQGITPSWRNLTEDQRVQVVQLMEQSKPKTLQKSYFLIMRELTMQSYYSRKESWNGLGIDSPPQPDGYLHLIKPQA